MPAKTKVRPPSAPGRPPKSVAGKQVAVAIKLAPEYADALRLLGGGILGAGVRIAATDRARELLDSQPKK